MKKLPVCLLIPILLAFLECWSVDDFSRSYFEFRKGDIMVYQDSTFTHTYWNSELSEGDSSWTTMEQVVIEVIGECRLKIEKRPLEFQLETRITRNDSVFADTTYARVYDDSVFFYARLDSSAFLVMPAEPRVGDTWKIGSITYSATDYDESPNGYPSCLKIQVSTADSTDHLVAYEHWEYWADDVGIVLTTTKTVHYHEDVYGGVTTDTVFKEHKLTSYSSR